jgi:hypothetical protein
MKRDKTNEKVRCPKPDRRTYMCQICSHLGTHTKGEDCKTGRCPGCEFAIESIIDLINYERYDMVPTPTQEDVDRQRQEIIERHSDLLDKAEE